MKELNVDGLTIMQRLQLFGEYIDKIPDSDLSSDKQIQLDKTSENELVELADKLDEDKDIDADATKANIFNTMDVNNDLTVDESEYTKFNQIMSALELDREDIAISDALRAQMKSEAQAYNSAKNGDVTNSTIENIKAQIDDKEDELDDLKEELEDINDDTEATVKDKLDYANELKAKYDRLVSTNATKNPEVANLIKQKNAKEDDIETYNDNLKKEQRLLQQNQYEYERAQRQELRAKNELEGYQDELEKLNKVKITDENREDIQKQKSLLGAQISGKQDRLDDIQQSMNNYSIAVSNAQANITLNNTEISKAKSAVNQCNSRIVSKSSQVIKDAYSNYMDAQNDYTAYKNNMISNKNQEISDTTNDISILQNQLTKEVTKEIQAQNAQALAKTQAATMASPVSSSNKSSSSGTTLERTAATDKLAAMAEKIHGNDKMHGKCAKGVADIIAKVTGQRTSGNGCDYKEVLSKRSDFVDVTSQVKSAKDILNLPPGYIVVWSKYEPGHTKSNGKYGHVMITAENGKEISDGKSNRCISYANWGASYTVFKYDP